MELVGQVVGQGWTVVAAARVIAAPMRARAVGQRVQLNLLDVPCNPGGDRLVGQGGVSLENAPRLSDRPAWVRPGDKQAASELVDPPYVETMRATEEPT
jgi:hypothetical protein